MRTIFIISILLLSLNIHAQKDAAAELYLDKISNDLSAKTALNISFSYLREDLQADTKIEGTGLLVMMNEKYKMELDDIIIYFDGEKQYSQNNEIEEVYISIPDADNQKFMFTDPIKLLRTYKDVFKYRLIGESSVQDKKATEVQLYPVNLEGPYSLLKLFFSPQDDELSAITIRQKDGVVYTLMVKELQKISDPGLTYFQFNQKDYPNVDVIELMD